MKIVQFLLVVNHEKDAEGQMESFHSHRLPKSNELVLVHASPEEL